MTPHNHREYVEGCYRCDLGRDEAGTVTLDEWAAQNVVGEQTDPVYLAAIEDFIDCLSVGRWRVVKLDDVDSRYAWCDVHGLIDAQDHAWDDVACGAPMSDLTIVTEELT